MTADQSPKPMDSEAIVLQVPAEGVDVLAFTVDEKQLGIALSIRTPTLGEFVIPLTGIHAAKLASTLRRLLRLPPAEAQALVDRLREQ